MWSAWVATLLSTVLCVPTAEWPSIPPPRIAQRASPRSVCIVRFIVEPRSQDQTNGWSQIVRALRHAVRDETSSNRGLNDSSTHKRIPKTDIGSYHVHRARRQDSLAWTTCHSEDVSPNCLLWLPLHAHVWIRNRAILSLLWLNSEIHSRSQSHFPYRGCLPTVSRVLLGVLAFAHLFTIDTVFMYWMYMNKYWINQWSIRMHLWDLNWIFLKVSIKGNE